VDLTIGIDVGGTKVAGGVVDEDGQVLASAREDTPTDAAALVRIVMAMSAGFASDFPVSGVGIGTAGWVDGNRDSALFAINVAWGERSVREVVSSSLGLPVVLENDANAAAWGEYRFGAGRRARCLVMITVGTGVGGGLVVNGQLWRGTHGIAGELGHTLAVPGGDACDCGRVGCLDAYASGRALVRLAGRTAAARPVHTTEPLNHAQGQPDAVTVPMLVASARRGDATAVAAFAEVGRRLGVALAGVVQVLDPDSVVVGGGLAAAGALLMDPLDRAYRSELGSHEHGLRPTPTLAELAAAGVVGAADLARHHVRGSR
jgi:glucokinase